MAKTVQTGAFLKPVRGIEFIIKPFKWLGIKERE
jgi:hypothetical protein